MKNDLRNDIEEIILTEEQIQKRIEELGAEINAAYADKPEELIMVGVLRGGFIFMADLARQIKRQVTFDFIDVSSYGTGTESSGSVRIIKDLEEDIKGKHVLIVEDIIDTGLTLKKVIEMLKTREPASIKVCTLLDKPARRTEKHITSDFNGFEIPDKFVVGYGLDYAEKYRNLPFIGVLKPEVYA
ncbi:hypoxanthine phosphoribosyltransferase [Anoxybacter fermentans]|uniref:Hypoxanthine phosphoribosyltransferase n=1 Tax=Anoxybacter fermentans TaxID=1323375 RepID=A0A3Q9HSY6_9FIRM|nr:hypoxanthine phosphoribosyltransferase [Anoxybacter fermentans]AZR74605.1 hypoxanthine phosphoribosyltransferase [Anoxybacter fermentans]